MERKGYQTEGRTLTMPVPFGMESEEEADAYLKVRAFFRHSL